MQNDKKTLALLIEQINKNYDAFSGKQMYEISPGMKKVIEATSNYQNLQIATSPIVKNVDNFRKIFSNNATQLASFQSSLQKSMNLINKNYQNLNKINKQMYEISPDIKKVIEATNNYQNLQIATSPIVKNVDNFRKIFSNNVIQTTSLQSSLQKSINLLTQNSIKFANSQNKVFSNFAKTFENYSNLNPIVNFPNLSKSNSFDNLAGISGETFSTNYPNNFEDSIELLKSNVVTASSDSENIITNSDLEISPLLNLLNLGNPLYLQCFSSAELSAISIILFHVLAFHPELIIFLNHYLKNHKLVITNIISLLSVISFVASLHSHI